MSYSFVFFSLSSFVRQLHSICVTVLFFEKSGLVQGVLHLLLLSMSAHITKQLGMAPGGEFRTAFREVHHTLT